MGKNTFFPDVQIRKMSKCSTNRIERLELVDKNTIFFYIYPLPTFTNELKKINILLLFLIRSLLKKMGDAEIEKKMVGCSWCSCNGS